MAAGLGLARRGRAYIDANDRPELSWAKRESKATDERTHRRETGRRRRGRGQGERGLVGDDQGRRPGPDHRAGGADHPVSAFQHPFGIAGADAVDRRLSVRFEIFLRLFPLFAARLPRPVAGGHARLARSRLRLYPHPLGRDPDARAARSAASRSTAASSPQSPSAATSSSSNCRATATPTTSNGSSACPATRSR